jgi:hypothetical protein
LSCLLGCGGKLEDDDDGEAEERGRGSDSEAPSITSITELPPCRLGFDPNLEPTRPCDWLANDLCYAQKLEACACICPRNRTDSLCSSGFYFPDGRTPVRCK